jgi:predicted negative regulator of RcsB-dependent stress response
VIISHGGTYDPAVLEMLDVALIKAHMHERRGDLQQHLGHSAEALKCYKKSNAYR